MRCIVTAGPTAEALDQVRRLTNMSTGRLGSELALYLTERGHEITLLIGRHATWRGEPRAHSVQTFTTGADLRERLRTQPAPDAVFHAAAVSDFSFGRVWRTAASGVQVEVSAGKISSRLGPLLAELVPTPKIIAELRLWFSAALLVGWKYEVDGDRSGVIQLARAQIAECRTDACVANGPAYGPGFGLVRPEAEPCHADTAPALFGALEHLLNQRKSACGGSLGGA